MADPNVLNVAGDIGKSAMGYFSTREAVAYRYGYAQPLLAPGGTDASRALQGAAERLEAAAQIQKSVWQLIGVGAGAAAFGLGGGPWAGVAAYGAVSSIGQWAAIREKERKLESPSEFYKEIEKSRFKEIADRASQGASIEYVRDLAKMGRLFGGLSASGGLDFGAAITPGRSATQLGMTPSEYHSMMSGAMSIGGIRGSTGIREDVLIRASKAGIYGSPAEVASSIAQGIRFGFTDRSVLDAARQLGTTAGEAAGLQVGLKTSIGLTGQAGLMEKMISGGFMSTNISSMSPQLALGIMNSVYQGSGQAGQGNEAISMLQYSAYRRNNPGASYWEFKRDQLSGFKTEKGRRTIGDITASGESGDFGEQMIASTMLGGAYSPIQFENPDIRKFNEATFRGGVPIKYRSKEGLGGPPEMEKASLFITEIEQRGISSGAISASRDIKDLGSIARDVGENQIKILGDQTKKTHEAMFEFNSWLTKTTKEKTEEVEKTSNDMYRQRMIQRRKDGVGVKNWWEAFVGIR